jgi:hypothetical protein
MHGGAAAGDRVVSGVPDSGVGGLHFSSRRGGGVLQIETIVYAGNRVKNGRVAP